MMATSTVTSKGQVTIPKEIRERLGLREGDRLIFTFDENGNVSVRAERPVDLDAVQGVLHHLARARPVSVAEMRQAVRRRAAKQGLGRRA